LYNFKFGHTRGSPAELIMSYLLWAPLTAKIKEQRLAETGNLPYEAGHPPRELFSNYAKEFIQDGLGDVVLYGGTYRDKVMRPAVEATLCHFIGGTPTPDAATCDNPGEGSPTVIVTHSLGGYMLMDAIDDEIEHEQAVHRKNLTSPGARIAKNTRYVYMLANQLALLDLTTLDTYPYPETPPTPDTCPTITKHRLLDKFSCDWAAAHGLPAAATTSGNNHLQIVAFSDPNDILSYLVSRADIGLPPDASEPQRRFYTNVYLYNREFDIPFFFADPYGAHLGYLNNPQVLDLFVCGMTNGSVKQPCPPPPEHP
jgi:hypothetical protein